MCSVLGLHVRQDSPRLRDKTARLYICNHVTHFDHNIINLLTSCNTVSFCVRLSVFPAWCNLFLLFLLYSALDPSVSFGSFIGLLTQWGLFLLWQLCWLNVGPEASEWGLVLSVCVLQMFHFVWLQGSRNNLNSFLNVKSCLNSCLHELT